MPEVIVDTLLDAIKLLPFLFVTYLAMEYLEHKAEDRMRIAVQRSGKLGPLYGSLLGIVPQCGFSAAAASLYAGRVVTLGTLLAVYLSTSDEMLPIMLSQHAPAAMIGKVLLTKVIIAMGYGFAIDVIFHNRHPKIVYKAQEIDVLCEQDNCGCEKNLLLSVLRHTGEVFLYILLVSFVLNLLVEYIGVDFLAGSVLQKPVIGEAIAALVGLLPNCAASVAITQMYLEGAIGAGAMTSGLLTGAGVGVLVLFRLNRHRKENLGILGLLYLCGLIGGLAVHLLGITF